MFDIDASIANGTLSVDVREYVANHSRSENIDLYLGLLGKSAETDCDALNDVLDAMTGWCNSVCRIGTGDYHLS